MALNIADDEKQQLPEKEIPGSYGIPFFSPIRDRLDYYYYYQGTEKYMQSKIDKYKSTVLRCNMPPGPFMARDPRVVAVLDAKSFQILFDNASVEKRDVLTGTQMPPVSFTGGYRVCAYLDPSEPTHKKVKQLLFNVLATRKDHILPAFRSSYAVIFDAMEAQLAGGEKDSKFDFNKHNDQCVFEFVCNANYGAKPSSFPDLGSDGGISKISKWLFLQIHPMMTAGLPKIIEEIFLHTFHLPAFLARSEYKALYAFFSSAASTALDEAEKLGLPRDEACHNLLFLTIVNAYAGMKIFFASILSWLSKASPTLHQRLATEVREAVKSNGTGELTVSSLAKMELVQSTLYEVLRIDPPVKNQYARAKKDLIIESHEAKFKVKKGEMLYGNQQFATRDEKVFGATAEEFIADRFLGEKGKELLKYVFWSNGRETDSSTVDNKQCPGKDLVVLAGRLFLAEFFLRYDTFTAEVTMVPFGSSPLAQVNVTSVTKAGESAK